MIGATSVVSRAAFKLVRTQSGVVSKFGPLTDL